MWYYIIICFLIVCLFNWYNPPIVQNYDILKQVADLHKNRNIVPNAQPYVKNVQ
jgi:hypothetical protein